MIVEIISYANAFAGTILYILAILVVELALRLIWPMICRLTLRGVDQSPALPSTSRNREGSGPTPGDARVSFPVLTMEEIIADLMMRPPIVPKGDPEGTEVAKVIYILNMVYGENTMNNFMNEFDVKLRRDVDLSSISPWMAQEFHS